MINCWRDYGVTLFSNKPGIFHFADGLESKLAEKSSQPWAQTLLFAFGYTVFSTKSRNDVPKASEIVCYICMLEPVCVSSSCSRLWYSYHPLPVGRTNSKRPRAGVSKNVTFPRIRGDESQHILLKNPSLLDTIQQAVLVDEEELLTT